MASSSDATKALGQYFGKPVANIFKDSTTLETEVILTDGTRFVLPEDQLANIKTSRPWENEYAILKNAMAMQPSDKRTGLGTVLDSELHRSKLIAMRLRLREGDRMPFQDLFTSLAGDKVFVFVVQDNQAVTLEDDANLFPSDQLITQLRLLDK